MTADQIIKFLQLKPHPEGGWYKQTWKSEDTLLGRASGTSIYFLLTFQKSLTGEKVMLIAPLSLIWQFIFHCPYFSSPLAPLYGKSSGRSM